MNPNPIQYQASQLWQTLATQETAWTYKQAIIKTWELLKQTGKLIVLLVLLVVVVLVWWWSLGYRGGYDFRKWLETEQPTLEELLQEAVTRLLMPFEWLANWAQDKVKELLGIPDEKAITPGAERKAIAPAPKRVTEVDVT
jgi:hypothetical protein